MYHNIESGADFYVDEDDYLKKDIDKKTDGTPRTVKVESSISPPPSTSVRGRLQPTTPESRGKKRPRRRITAVHSYAVPDSDDDAIIGSEYLAKKSKQVETSLQKWIHHLGELVKDEQRKVRSMSSFFLPSLALIPLGQYKQEKKNVEITLEHGTKVRFPKARCPPVFSVSHENDTTFSHRMISSSHCLLSYGNCVGWRLRNG